LPGAEAHAGGEGIGIWAQPAALDELKHLSYEEEDTCEGICNNELKHLIGARREVI